MPPSLNTNCPQIDDLRIPFKWYNDRSKQTRHRAHCKLECDFKLITDRFHLLPFMVRRAHDCQLMTNWILRCADVNPCEGIIPKIESEFTVQGAWVPGTWVIDDGIARLTAGAPGSFLLTYPGIITPLTCYKVSYDVRCISGIESSENPGDASIKLRLGGVDGATHTGTGHYTDTITSGAGVDLEFIGTLQAGGQVVEVDNLKICPCFEVLPEDIELDLDLLAYRTINGVDYIMYFGENLGVCLECGDYESIMYDGENVLYSEIISIRDFTTSTSPYLKLEWWNSCDLGDILYQEFAEKTGIKSYKNILWLDTLLNEPEYPFEEEGENNGINKFIPSFQKWQKTQSLDTMAVPEFIADALTLMKMHDTIYLIPALREEASQVDSPVCVENVNYELEWITLGCNANIKLGFTIDEIIVDSSCCSNLTLDACETPDFEAMGKGCLGDAVDPLEGAYFLQINCIGNPDGLFQWNGLIWVPVVLVIGQIIHVAGDPSNFWYYWDGAQFIPMPQIITITPTGPNDFNILVTMLPGACGQLCYSETMGGPYTPIGNVFTGDPSGITTASLQGLDMTGTCYTYYFVLKVYTFNCDYGQSAEFIKQDISGC